MKPTSLFTLLLIAPFLLSTPLLAQKGKSSERDIHREIAQLESQLLSCLEQKEANLAATQKRNQELIELQREQNRVEGPQRDKVGRAIDVLRHQTRMDGIESGQIQIEIERLKVQIAKLTRVDLHLAEDDDPRQGKGRRHEPAPKVKSVRNVKFTREGPVRTPQGVGYYDTSIYEVVFTDNSRQTIEQKVYSPLR